MVLPVGSGHFVTRSRSTNGSVLGRSRIPRRRSIDYTVREIPQRGPGGTVRKVFEITPNALHNLINEDSTTKDEDSFSALEGLLEKLISENFKAFYEKVEQLGTLAKDV